jgi:ribosomal protein L11 methyltransferase
MALIEGRLPITPELSERLETHFCESYQEYWMLEENWKTHEVTLRGFFHSREEADSEWIELQAAVSGLVGEPTYTLLEDQDWKEAYKLHFKPWSERGLHWVPLWEKESYRVPAGEEVVYLDPGMAFGTGNHETTRLCVRRLLDYRDEYSDDLARRTVIDAGCGSGILAISAAKLGFEDVYGFDLDPDSVRISAENEALCGLHQEIDWAWANLEDGLKGRKADLLLANILAPVLVDHALLLLESIRPGGELVLSGILAREVDQVHKAFVQAASGSITSEAMDSRIEGEWADLRYISI